jgi:hypothetical protein
MLLHDKRLHRTNTRFLFVLLFANFSAAILGDNTAEALLLSHFDTTLLPRMFLLNALALFAVSAAFMFLIDRVDRGFLFVGFAAGHAAVLLMVRAATVFNAEWLFPLLFTYAYIMKIFAFLIFWTLANDLIDSRRAQKKFPLIAAGGTIGAVITAFAIPGLVKLFAAENLLYVWSGGMCIVAALAAALRKKMPQAFKRTSVLTHRNRISIKTITADVTLFRTDPLFANMAVLYALLFFILIVQQYFFYVEVKSQFQTAQKIAEFLGFFNGVSMIAALLLQLGVAGKVLRRFGSTRSMMFLPVILAVVFILQALLSITSLRVAGFFFDAVIIGMGLRIAFFDSLFSPNVQVFFSSFPRAMRGRAKLALEGAVKPAAILIAGLWLMVGTRIITVPAQLFILAVIALILLVISLRLKVTYRESLMTLLAGMPSRMSKKLLTGKGGDEEFIRHAREILHKGKPELQNYLIERLAVSPVPEFIALLKEHAHHVDPRVRADIVTALGGVSAEEHREFIVRCLDDKDSRVVANAIMETGSFTMAEVTAKLQELQHHESARVRANASIMLWRRGRLKDLQNVFEFLEKMLYGPVENDRASALYALGEITEQESMRLVCEFARQSAPSSGILNQPVFRQLVKALGKKDSSMTLDVILGLAHDAYRWQISEIVSALAFMIEQHRTVDLFLEKFGQKSPINRNVLIKALCETFPNLSKEQASTIRCAVREEINELELDWRALELLRRVRHVQGIELLRCAIREESIERRLDTAINAMCLFDPQGNVRKVTTGLLHADPHIRARAIEVLDSAGDVQLNRLIIRIIDNNESSGDPAVKAERFKGLRDDLLQTIGRYRTSTNSWVNRCAENAEKEIHKLGTD